MGTQSISTKVETPHHSSGSETHKFNCQIDMFMGDLYKYFELYLCLQNPQFFLYYLKILKYTMPLMTEIQESSLMALPPSLPHPITVTAPSKHVTNTSSLCSQTSNLTCLISPQPLRSSPKGSPGRSLLPFASLPSFLQSEARIISISINSSSLPST